MPDIGGDAPNFILPSTAGELNLRELAPKGKVLLAFYYEDNTPLCSSEISVFKEDYGIVEELGVQLVAVSADSLESHRAFAERLGGLPFPLASDELLEAAKAYNVVDDSGKRSRRAVFVIDRNGRILHAERWFQPGNPSQYEAIYRALGFEE
jgi:peroxiredoxin Q/BCP